MDGMEQQIAPSATAQASSGAVTAASGRGKSAAKGMFAALLSIIEGKSKPTNGKGSEKLFEQVSAQGDVKQPASPKAKTAQEAATAMVAAAAESTIQIDSQRPGLKMKGNDLLLRAEAEPTQNSEKGVAASAVDTSGIKHGKPAVTAALSNEDESESANDAAKAKSNNHPVKASGAGKEMGIAFTAGMDRPANATSEALSTPTVESARDGKAKMAASDDRAVQPHHPATATTEEINVAQQVKAKMATSQPTSNIASKAGESATASASHGMAANQIRQNSAPEAPIPSAGVNDDLPAQEKAALATAPTAPAGKGMKAPAATSGRDMELAKARAENSQSISTTAVQTEESASAEKIVDPRQVAARQPAQPAAELKAEQKQPVMVAMQADKSGVVLSEATLAGNMSELQRFSTNHFVKNRKVNLDNLSKSQTASAMAGGDKKPDALANNPKHIFVTQGEAPIPVARDVAMPAEALPRAGQPAVDSASSAQSFQIVGAEATSTRAAGHTVQATPHISGPWSVAAAMQQIGHAAAQGKFQLELTLNPEHLGKIQVFLESDASKQIQVHLVVDQPASRQPIEQHLPMLRQALAEQGLNMDSFSMASSGQNQENPEQRQQDRPLPSGTATADNSNVNERPVHAAAESRLSIRI